MYLKKICKKVACVLMATLMLLPAIPTKAGTVTIEKYVDASDAINLWVGDSRTVLIYQDLMYNVRGKGYASSLFKKGRYIYLKYGDCYAGRGTGYYFVKNADKTIRSTISQPGRQNVVFGSGVNDMWNPILSPFKKRIGGKLVSENPEVLAREYWKLYYKRYISRYPEDRFYLLSVNPVYGTTKLEGTKLNNAKIKRFNATLKKYIKNSPMKNVVFVDTYNDIFIKRKWANCKKAYRYAATYRKLPGLLKERNSFQLHYTRAADQEIYRYVNKTIIEDK
ncbi:MAG: hypothetical protein Q4E53_01595 [Eubacteriales bacterium]|nr:hypothetical protein [Eubacteriales bacterium]